MIIKAFKEISKIIPVTNNTTKYKQEKQKLLSLSQDEAFLFVEKNPFKKTSILYFIEKMKSDDKDDSIFKTKFVSLIEKQPLFRKSVKKVIMESLSTSYRQSHIINKQYKTTKSQIINYRLYGGTRNVIHSLDVIYPHIKNEFNKFERTDMITKLSHIKKVMKKVKEKDLLENNSVKTKLPKKHLNELFSDYDNFLIQSKKLMSHLEQDTIDEIVGQVAPIKRNKM